MEETKKPAHPFFDGFRNFVTQLGITPEARVNGMGGVTSFNKLSAGHYGPNLLSKNRMQLEWCYRGNWVAGQVIDTYAEDMTREGITVISNDESEKAQDLHPELQKLNIHGSMTDAIKWGRLYGGAIGVMQILGQSPDMPLDVDTIGQGQFKGLVIYDRWQIQPDLTRVIDVGPEIGLPEYYKIVTNWDFTKPKDDTGLYPAMGYQTVHYSRVIRFTGIQLPFFQAVSEQMWGESVLERLWDRLIAFDETTMSVANLVDRAQLRMVKVSGLRELIAMGGKSRDNLLEFFDTMRTMQRNEGLTLLDKEDDYAADTYSFGGLSDVMLQFGQQISGSAQIPLVRLFGQSPAGLSATGESDMRMYYDNIRSQQEARLRHGWDKIIEVAYRSLHGESAPADIGFFFNPLWQLSDLDKATVNKTNAETIIAAHQQGGITTAGMMKQLRESGGEDGLFSHITDEDIEDAENIEPPLPSEQNGPLNPDPPKDGGPSSEPDNSPAVKNIDEAQYESVEDRKILQPLKWFKRTSKVS